MRFAGILQSSLKGMFLSGKSELLNKSKTNVLSQAMLLSNDLMITALNKTDSPDNIIRNVTVELGKCVAGNDASKLNLATKSNQELKSQLATAEEKLASE